MADRRWPGYLGVCIDPVQMPAICALGALPVGPGQAASTSSPGLLSAPHRMKGLGNLPGGDSPPHRSCQEQGWAQ